MGSNAKYCVGLNFRAGNIEELLERHGDVLYEVYAAAPSDVCNTGRRGHVWSTPEEIKRQTALAHDHGVAFNVLMNASCQGGWEFSLAFQKRVIEFVKFIDDVGVDSVTIANPFLIDLVRKHSARLNIVAGSIAEITDPLRIERYESHGVNRIVLHWNVYRNFERLKEIRASTTLPLEIVVNQGCLHQCENFYAHANITAHSSTAHDDALPKLGDYYTPVKQCRITRQVDPVEFLMSAFIRPEDLALYESIGIDFFKFAGRRYSTEWIMGVLDAYVARTYDGNVFDLSSHIGENPSIADVPNRILDGWLEEIGSSGDYEQFRERAEHYAQKNAVGKYFAKPEAI